MKPAANISVDVPEPIQPKKTGAFAFEKLRQFKNKIAAGALSVLGLATSAGEIIAINLGPTSTSFSDKTQSHQILESTTSRTIVIPTTQYGGTISITFGYKTDGSELQATQGIYYDLNQHIYRVFNGNPRVEIGATLPIYDGPGGTRGTSAPTGFGTMFDYTGTYTDTFDVGPAGGTFNYQLVNQLETQYIKGQSSIYGATTSSPINQAIFTPNSTAPNPADTNLNSISDSWEITHFGGLLEPANGDPDHDGLDNLLEYAFNTDPLVPNNKSPITYSFETVGSEKYLCITYPKNPTATNLTYTAETSSDLVHWASDAMTIPISATSEKVRDIVPVSKSSKRFIRLKISSNP